MLPTGTMLESLTIIAEKRKNQNFVYGADFETPTISNFINKEFTHFVKETTIKLLIDYIHLDVKLDGEGFSTIPSDFFTSQPSGCSSRTNPLSVDEMKTRFICQSSRMPEFTSIDGQLVQKDT